MNSLKVVPAPKERHFLVVCTNAWSSSSKGAYLVSAEVNILKLLSNCGQVAVSSSEIPDRSSNLRL